MGTLCLSSATILRCETLTRIQSEVLIIPAALELICTVVLIFTRRDSGTFVPGVFVATEGWIYFSLALLDLLSHLLPAARFSMSVFTIIDIVIASTSFLPILSYMLALFLLVRAEFVADLPERFQNVAKLTLIFFIPTVVGLNEVSSIIGLTRRTIQIGSETVIAIGFRTTADQSIWTFFTSLTLALLTAYQAVNFCFIFYRVIKIFVDKRNIESLSYDANHLFRGTGWIAAGIKLGAIETLIGFAQYGFAIAMTRRILRFLSRLFLVIGLLKGVDTVEDFQLFRKEMQKTSAERRKGEKLRALISNPRVSTFRRMSQPNLGVDARSPSVSFFPNAKPAPAERVTVRYRQDKAPTLLLRFSNLNIPSPTSLQESINSRPVSSWSDTFPSSTFLDMSNTASNPRTSQLPSSRISGSARTTSLQSMPDSIHAVVEMASQFPSLPPLPPPSRNQYPPPYSWVARGKHPSTLPIQTLPTIISSASSISEQDLDGQIPPPSAVALGKRRAIVSSVNLDVAALSPTSDGGQDIAPNNYSPQPSEYSFSTMASPTTTTFATVSHAQLVSYSNESAKTNREDSLSSAHATISHVHAHLTLPTPMPVGDADYRNRIPLSRPVRSPLRATGPRPPPRQLSISQISMDRDDLSERLREQVQRSGGGEVREAWVSPPADIISDDESAMIENVVVTRRAEVARIKSVGSAPRKNTPEPTPQNMRGSVTVELLSSPDAKAADAKQRKRMTYMLNGTNTRNPRNV